jgi:hypothetical protein
LRGRFISLFDPAQQVVTSFDVAAGTRAFLVDLDRYPTDHVGVVAAACEVTNQRVTDDAITFDVIGQADTDAVVSVLLPKPPRQVTLADKPLDPARVGHAAGVLKLRFANEPTSRNIFIAR